MRLDLRDGEVVLAEVVDDAPELPPQLRIAVPRVAAARGARIVPVDQTLVVGVHRERRKGVSQDGDAPVDLALADLLEQLRRCSVAAASDPPEVVHRAAPMAHPQQVPLNEVAARAIRKAVNLEYPQRRPLLPYQLSSPAWLRLLMGVW